MPVALVLALLSLFALKAVNAPPLSDQPTSFDGTLALTDVRTLVEEFPKRTMGSPNDERLVAWLSARIKSLGLQPHLDPPVPATVDGRDTTLRNVWALEKGRSEEVVLLLANRDSPPLSTQGANDNASGIAALLELARVFSLQSHQLTLIFLWTDGDDYGALGARAFVSAHPDLKVRAAVALRGVGLAGASAVRLDGWSAADRVAPPWLWVLARDAAVAEGRFKAPLPNVVTQLIRLAAPVGSGSQGPFVAQGVPALSLSMSGDVPAPQQDTMNTVSAATLRRAGRTVERMVTTLDGLEAGYPDSGSTVFFSQSRMLPGLAVQLAITVLLVPFALVTLDLLAAGRRRHARLGPAWLLYFLRVAPWFALLVVVYIANLVSLLPRIPGAVIPPDSLIAHHPRYLRVFILLALLVAIALYAHAVERKRVRRRHVPCESTVTVVHLVTVLVTVVLLIGDPFSALLLLPAALLWPLARPGPWQRSRLPAWAGLAGLAVVLVYYAGQSGLGIDVWWYFFLLVEQRGVPVWVTVLGILFVAAAIHLGHHLHATGAAAKDRRSQRADDRSAGRTDRMGTETGAPRSPGIGDRGAPVS